MVTFQRRHRHHALVERRRRCSRCAGFDFLGRGEGAGHLAVTADVVYSIGGGWGMVVVVGTCACGMWQPEGSKGWNGEARQACVGISAPVIRLSIRPPPARTGCRTGGRGGGGGVAAHGMGRGDGWMDGHGWNERTSSAHSMAWVVMAGANVLNAVLVRVRRGSGAGESMASRNQGAAAALPSRYLRRVSMALSRRKGRRNGGNERTNERGDQRMRVEQGARGVLCGVKLWWVE
ncbi:hypothetical protein BZA05DRAFT_8542 [Tricharina praecox]|uniref:uncharacterized protein n=1 Tax=Tricharina praecox TaxID=43433 RepID=UPI0022209D27|nr:uncharacterized protein BZA05DRAFT_8542 [Tricharina praecox]KAI5858600.1 hypothetical protein BZA05DRAFT_8542 [Tricharina praecox]